MATIHIDETAGSDVTGKGTTDLPYQSLAFALFTHAATPSLQLLIRKDPSGTYEEPTQSSLKKAKKNADGLEKKRKKQEELAEREAKEKGAERERRERILEASKQVVLVENMDLPKPTKVSSFLIYFYYPLNRSPRRCQGEDRAAGRLTFQACPHIRLGTSSTPTKGHYILGFAGRNRLFANCSIWSRRMCTVFILLTTFLIFF